LNAFIRSGERKTGLGLPHNITAPGRIPMILPPSPRHTLDELADLQINPKFKPARESGRARN